MNPDQAQAVLRDALRDIAPDADLAVLDPEEDMRTAFDLDSVDFLSLVEAIATRTGVEIPESDYRTVRSLRGMVDHLAARSPG